MTIEEWKKKIEHIISNSIHIEGKEYNGACTSLCTTIFSDNEENNKERIADMKGNILVGVPMTAIGAVMTFFGVPCGQIVLAVGIGFLGQGGRLYGDTVDGNNNTFNNNFNNNNEDEQS